MTAGAASSTTRRVSSSTREPGACRELGCLCGTGEARVAALMDEAIRAGIVEAAPEDPGSLRYTHELIGETIAGESSAAGKLDLHLAIATGLERAHGESLEAFAAEILKHLVAAGPRADPQQTVRYAIAAGNRMLAAGQTCSPGFCNHGVPVPGTIRFATSRRRSRSTTPLAIVIRRSGSPRCMYCVIRRDWSRNC